MKEQLPPIKHEPPTRTRTRRGFLIRPFWRDYVFSYVLIGGGIVLGDIGAPQRGADRWWFLAPALASLGVGFAFFFCAIGHGLWNAWRRMRRALIFSRMPESPSAKADPTRGEVGNVR